MQGISRKIWEYHILFWPWPLPLGKENAEGCWNFPWKSGARDQYLQNAACTNFAKEKSKAPTGEATWEVQHATGKELTHTNISSTSSRYIKRHAPLYPVRAIYCVYLFVSRRMANGRCQRQSYHHHATDCRAGHHLWPGRYIIDVSSIRLQPSIIKRSINENV